MNNTMARVLIVDDESLVRSFLSHILESSGRFETITAENGIDAFEKCCSDDTVSLVISDLNMPEMDGLALIRKIREAKMDVPIVVMSANNEISIALNALNSGANDYLTKDENIQELIVLAVDKALEKKHIQDENRRLLNKVLKQQELMEQELKVASEVQRAMLPSIDAYKNNPWKIHAFYDAAVDVGGDFYDFMDYGENRMAFFIADVSGHGPSAAMIMAMLKAFLHGESSDLPSPSEMMRRLNGKLTSMIPEGSFVTAFFCVIDSISKTITYSRAGHHSSFLLSQEKNTLLELNTEGSVLGMFHDEEFVEASATYSSGDKLLMCSDGMFEVHNKDTVFGYDRFRNLAESCSCNNGKHLVETVVKEVTEFWDGESHRDDMALIVVEFL